MNKILLSSALIAAFAVSGVAGEHEWELNGVLKNETSVFLKNGTTYNGAGHDAGDILKMENSINLFINGDLTDNAALHIQGNLIHDNEGIDGFRGHRSHSQHDYLREFYIDTSIEDSAIGSWDIRVGKQQVVWGTADGVKFLDIINPTDYREWGQNTMEDSRIPLWMVTAETSIGDDSSLQLVWVPDIQINQISGLINPNTGDYDSPFVSMGAETLTGRTNGFMNIARDMGQTSTIFNTLLGMGGMRGLLGPMKYRTVEFFTSLGTPSAPSYSTDGGATSNPMTFANVQSSIDKAYATILTSNTGGTALSITAGDKLSTGFSPELTHDLVAVANNPDFLTNGVFDATKYVNACFGTPGTNPANPSGPVDLALLHSVFIPLVSSFNSNGAMVGQVDPTTGVAVAQADATATGNSVLAAAANNGQGLFAGFASYMTGFGPDAATALTGFAGATDAQKVAGLTQQGFTQLAPNTLISNVRINMNNFNFTDDTVKSMVSLGIQLLTPYSQSTNADDAFKVAMYNQFVGFSGALAGLEAAVAAGDQATQGAISMQMLTGSFGLSQAEAGALLTQTADATTLAKFNAGVDAFLANGLGAFIDPMLALAPSFGSGTTNQFDGTFSESNPTSAFDYMGETAFGTFFYFQGMKTAYRQDHENSSFQNHNLGLRFKSTAFDSLNYSLNYYYHWDNNPYVKPHWEDSSGNRLTTNYQTHSSVPIQETTAGNNAFKSTNFDNVGASAGVPDTVTALESMKYADGSYFSPYSIRGTAAAAQGSLVNPATLVFTEAMNRIHSIGGSFDYAVDTDFAPFVVRGEFVYDAGAKTTVIDRSKLAYGDLVGAFGVEEADFVKYVIGIDVTVMTNLFTSFQFMDVWNLDYVEQNIAYNGKTYQKYTANPATMNLSNGLKAAEEHAIMYTLFLSKPFLESDALRVNNLLLVENENGGIWNRLDAEYTYSDEIVLTAEWNQYGNDKNGVFGQFEDASSVQVGFKYIF